MEPIAWIPIAVFAVVYLVFTFEWADKAAVSLLGAGVLVIFDFASEHEIVTFIDTETIMLLLGMMVMVSVLTRSGIFSLLSVRIAELTKGDSIKILVLFSLITALMSAFLDNVTTVLIIIPIILELTKGMGLDPKPYVISQALVSNIGGTATLIGDPPNIIIGSQVGLSFNQFVANLLIPVVATLIIALVWLWATNRKVFSSIDSNLMKLFSVNMLLRKIRFDFLDKHMDWRLITKSLVVLAITLGLFVTQTITGITPGIVALTMAMVLLVISRIDVHHVLEDVEWSTLLFFAGLFMMVGVLEEYGVIEAIAHGLVNHVGSNPYMMVLVVLWGAGIFSGFLDNIPFTITMIPVVQVMLESTPVPNNILWWALALGACFGGNITMIGSSANVVTTGIARKHGESISFISFMKYGVPIALISLIVSSIYLIIYLRLSL